MWVMAISTTGHRDNLMDVWLSLKLGRFILMANETEG